jgi:hypothetical protein
MPAATSLRPSPAIAARITDMVWEVGLPLELDAERCAAIGAVALRRPRAG